MAKIPIRENIEPKKYRYSNVCSYLTIFGYDLETNSSALVSMFSINYAILLFVLLF